MTQFATLLYETTVAVTVNLDSGEVDEVVVLDDKDEPQLSEDRTSRRNRDLEPTELDRAWSIAEEAREAGEWPTMQIGHG